MTQKGGSPSWKDWRDLSSVLMLLNSIVEDGPEQSSRREPASGWGLLAPACDQPLAEPLGRRSKIASLIPLLPYDPITELLRVLPGSDNIGSSPAERVSTLYARLSELSAYCWLRKQPEYLAACETIRRVQRPNGTEHEQQWLELRMLRAVQSPLSEFYALRAAGYAPQYPEPAALDQASRKAKQLRNFLQQNGGLFLGSDALSWDVMRAAEVLTDQLQALVPTYKKKRADAPILEIQFMQAVAKALKEEFGSCSPTILERLCDLIGYRPGGLGRKVQRVASAINNPGSNAQRKVT